MDAAAAFRPLNLILFSLGCPSTANLESRINLGCWIVFMMNIAGLIIGILLTIPGFRFDKTFWTYMVFPLDFCFALYFLFVMKTRSSHLKLTLTNLSFRLNSNQLKSLKFLAMAGSLLSIFYSLNITVSYINFYFLQKEDDIFKETGLNIFLYIISLKDYFIIAGRFIFCFFIRMSTFADINMMLEMQSTAESHSKETTPSKVSLLLKKSTETRDNLLSLFAGLPVVWFLREFAVLVGQIIQPEEWKKENIFLTLTLFVIPPVMSLSSHVFLVCFIDYCNKQVRKQADELDQALTSVNYKKWFPVLTEINEYKKYEFSACDFFDINKSVGLSFLSALITFTVLFQQILESSFPEPVVCNSTTFV